MEKPTAVENEHPHHHDHHRRNRRKSVDRKTFSLETYLGFLITRDHRHLSVDHINKIVSIHGLKKGAVRKTAEENLSLITNPIHPARSTLKDDILPSKSVPPKIALKEVIKDLKLLNWQECSISSVKTICADTFSNNTTTTDIPPANIRDDDVSLSEAAAKLMALKGSKRRRRTRSPSPVPLATDATSMMSSGSAPNENGFSTGDCMASPKALGFDTGASPSNVPEGCVSSSKLLGGFVLPPIIPEVGVKKRKTGIKRVYLKNLYNNDDKKPDVAASHSPSTTSNN